MADLPDITNAKLQVDRNIGRLMLALDSVERLGWDGVHPFGIEKNHSWVGREIKDLRLALDWLEREIDKCP